MIEPVEIQITRHHAYEKTGRGCKACRKAKYHPDHIGHSDSFNGLGSGNQFVYQNMKKGWQEALALALDASQLPRGLSHVLVEGQMCFPTAHKRDQGNHRMIVEKALGDALVNGYGDINGGWLDDDTWEQYEFGGLTHLHRKGESWTRLMLFPQAVELAVAA